jgi:hypothetical protein
MRSASANSYQLFLNREITAKFRLTPGPRAAKARPRRKVAFSTIDKDR